MDTEAARNRIKELRDQIERANHAYYVGRAPIMSDEEWDAQFDELRRLEDEFPDLVTADSPTQRVGATQPISTDFRPVSHSLPMLSLGKANTESELREWDARVRRLL